MFRLNIDEKTIIDPSRYLELKESKEQFENRD